MRGRKGPGARACESLGARAARVSLASRLWERGASRAPVIQAPPRARSELRAPLLAPPAVLLGDAARDEAQRPAADREAVGAELAAAD